MTNREEWNEFLENLFSNALKEYQKTKEYKYLQEKHTHIDEILKTNLSVSENKIVADCIFEISLDAERQIDFIYRKGLKDCIFILKELGMLM